MELNLINDSGAVQAKLPVSDFFAREYSEGLVHQVLVAYHANARSANRAQKSRGEINKSTRKPWKQKGTGRARAGMASSPLWRGGGKIFPNKPDENFSHKVNRKMYRAAISAIFSELARSGRLAVIDEVSVSLPKTRVFAEKLKNLKMGDSHSSVLFLVDQLDDKVLLASRNLPFAFILPISKVDPESLIRFANVIMTKAALAEIERGQQ